MRLLIASSVVPCGAPESGFEIANQSLIDALARAGVEIVHLGYQWPRRALTYPKSTISLGTLDLKTDNAPTAQKIKWLAKAIQTRTPFASAKLRLFSDHEFEAKLKNAGPFSGLVLNGVGLSGAYEKVLTGLPFIFVAHNVEHSAAQDAADSAASIIEKLMYRREARLLRALEERLAKRARHVLALSDEDRDAPVFQSAQSASTLPLVTPPSVAPNSTRYPAFDAGMIGTWTWTPNRIGLEWFLQEVMPLMPAQVSIAIAGSLPQGFPRRDKRVTFLGRVDDAKAFMRQCRIVTLTARAGSGIQLKTLETMEMGLPAVATKSSLRGISDIPANIRSADSAREFAAALSAQIVDHKTGVVTDLDGTAFRHAQIDKMDGVLESALSTLT